MSNDMRQVTAPKSDQMNADDLIAGSRTITIMEVKLSPGTEQPISVFYQGDDGKPYKPCKSMARLMMAAWGANAGLYAGRSMTLYNDPEVKWGGIPVGGIRISHLSHIEADMIVALTATRGKKTPYKVKALNSAPGDSAAHTALMNAATLAELETAWRSKGMAPFRDSLTDLLAERKAALAGAEPTTKPLWMTLVESAATAPDAFTVEALQATFDANEDEIPLDRLGEVQDALNAAMGRFGEGE